MPAVALPFTVIVERSGDRAKASTLEGAFYAARILCRDHANGVGGIQGAFESARRSVIILENGTYAGTATELARAGWNG